MERLSGAGEVVLFRPFHESNGDWFWWGRRDRAVFAAAWRGLFAYLTAAKGLHNLLWVYSANRSLGDPASDPTRFFPGTDVVDVVGLDIYDDNLSDAPAGAAGYAAMVGLGRPFGLIKAQYPATVLATAWYSSGGNNWQISDKPDPAALLLDPWAVTL